MNKALVTGAAGFIGSNVVRVLLDEGVEVRAMVLPGEDQRNISGLDVEVVEGNVLDPPGLARAIKSCDTLFHLAGIYSIWRKDRGDYYRVNLQGSRNMLWEAKRADVEKIVYTSSIAGLGVKPGMELTDEETEFNQWGQNDYILTKHLSQQEALTFAREGMPIVVVNPCFPYGEGDVAPTPTGKIILDVANGMQFMYFEGGLNIVDVMDVARGHVLAAKHGEIGEKYILGNENVTIGELFELVAKVAELKVRFIKMPLFAAKAFGYSMEKLADLTGIPPITTSNEVSFSAQYLFYDTSKAREKLGLEPSPVEDSLRRAIEWFKREGYIPAPGIQAKVTGAIGRLLAYLPGG